MTNTFTIIGTDQTGVGHLLDYLSPVPFRTLDTKAERASRERALMNFYWRLLGSRRVSSE